MIHEGFKNNPEIFFKGTIPWKWLRYFTPQPHSTSTLPFLALLMCESCCHWYWHCFSASRVKAVNLSLIRLSSSVLTQQWTSHLSKMILFLSGNIWAKSGRLAKNATFPIRFQWDHWLLQCLLLGPVPLSDPAVCITLRLKITCLGDLTPAQHSKQHDSMLYNGSCYVNYAPPFNPLCPPTFLPFFNAAPDFVWTQPQGFHLIILVNRCFRVI